jgi:hypothetical protein
MPTRQRCKKCGGTGIIRTPEDGHYTERVDYVRHKRIEGNSSIKCTCKPTKQEAVKGYKKS